MHSSKERLLSELNRLNTQSLLTTDVGFANPGATGAGLQTRLTAVALSTGTVASAGQADVLYNRMDLETAFNITGRTLSVMVGDSVRAILPSLRRYTGLVIDPSDVEDTAISWVDDQASVELTATANSLGWVGSTPITLTLQPLQLSSVFRNPVVDMSDIDIITRDNLFFREMRSNGGYVPADVVEWSVPRTVVGNGYNTLITLTAKPDTGYAGSVDFAYKRRDIGEVFGTNFAVRDEATSAWGLVPYLVKAKGNIIAIDDVLNTQFDFSQNPAPNTVTANPSSMTYAGTSNITLQRRGANNQTITLNFTEDDLALSPTRVRDAVVAADNGQPFADVIINVAKNITLVGADSTQPTLRLDNYGTISQTDYYINNLGSIYGRGGNGGSATVPAGQNGADALYNAQSDNNLFIDNQGRIAGGGGGGGVQRPSSSPGLGGGAAPFGVGGDGSVATLTNYTVATSYNNGSSTATGGNGGAVGVNGITPTTASLDYTQGGSAGAVVGGSADKVSWITMGIQVPFPDSMARPTYATQPVNVYLDPADATKIAAYMGPTVATAWELRATFVADALGMTEGSPSSDTSTQVMYLAYLDGKFLGIPYQLLRSAISWNTLYTTGVVFGDKSYGNSPPAYNTPTKQYQPWRVGSDVYSMRLMQGANVDSMTSITTGITANSLSANTEWDRLMSLLIGTTSNPAQPGSKWVANAAAASWGLVSGIGSACWTREKVDLSTGIRRIYRGPTDGLGINSNAPDLKATTYGWRPVLEWEGPVASDEYQRFLDWLATNPSDVALQLNTATSLSSSPYFTDSANGGIYNKLVSYYAGTGLNTMYGSPWGTYFGDNGSWGSIWTHCMPTRIAAQDLVVNRRVVLAYLKTNPKSYTFPATTRNLYTSTAGTTSNSQQWALQVTKFVYFDSVLGKMMQCDPSTKSTSTEFFFWSGEKTPLTDLITNLTLGSLPSDTDDDNFLDRVFVLNNITEFADTEMVFSAPVAYSGSEGNTKVTITAVDGGRYSGSVDVYFTRQATKAGRAVPAQFQWPLSVDTQCTMYAFLQAYHPGMLDTYFSDVSPEQFDSTMLSFTAGVAPAQLTVVLGSKYVGQETTTVDINPVQANWWGADTLAAWDTSMFNASGFNDVLGNPMLIRTSIYGVSGTTAKSDQSNPVFSGAVQLYGAGIFTSAGRITPAQLQAAWTVDMWYYNTSDGYNATGAQNRLPLFFIGSTVNHSAAAAASRLLIGSSSNNPGYVTGYINSTNPTAYGPRYDPLMLRKGWGHLAVTYDGNSLFNIYVNGLLLGQLANMPVASASTSWETGVFGYVFGGTVPKVEVERWRFRSGVKITANFDPNKLYAPNFSNPKALSSMVKSQTLSATPPENTNATKFLKLISLTGAPLDPVHITVSDPVAYTGPEGNTKVTLTAVSGGIYTGTIDIYYTRVSMAVGTLPTKLYRFADTVAFTGTTFAYLQKYFPDVLTNNYPNRTSSDFSTTTFTIALGDLPTQNLVVVPADVWRYLTEDPIAVNPKEDNWQGVDLVMGFESADYVQAGWTDKAGNTLKGLNNVAGTAGNYPSKSTQAFAYGGGLIMNNASVITAAALPASAYTEPFTMDFWVKFANGAPTASSAMPLPQMYASPNAGAFSVNNRLQYGSHDATLNGMSVWNNQATARLITTPNAVLLKAGWHHFAMMYDGSVFRYYADGVLFATSSTWVVQGAAWQMSILGQLISSNYPIIERFRYRKGLKFNPVGFLASDLYPSS